MITTSTTSTTPKYPLDPSWPPEVPELEAQLFALINAHRASIGVAPVKRAVGVLTDVAAWKARQMAAVGYLAHDDQDTPGHVFRSIGERFVDLGYPATSAWGENAAYGFQDPQLLMNAFLSDTGHKANIENPSWLYVGVGWARLTNANFPNGLDFQAQDFGTWDSGAITPPPVDPPPVTPPPVTPPPEDKPKAGETWVNRATGGKVKITNVTNLVSYSQLKANGKLGVARKPRTVAWFVSNFYKAKPISPP